MSDFKKTTLKRRIRRVTKMVLGYTRTGRVVLRPTHEAPNMNDIDVYRSIKAKAADWTRGDHVDAARILLEHGEREPDPKLATWCGHWSRMHRDLGKRLTSKIN